MFNFNFFTGILAIAQVFGPITAAPIRVSSITQPRVIQARQTGSSAECMMERSGMTLNLAAAMNSMTTVQAAVNDTNVQDVQNGIMGAMISLTMLSGAMANSAMVPAYLPNAMVNNITMSLSSVDSIQGVPDATTAAEITAAQQQLQNAGQYAMMIISQCVNPSSVAAPASSSVMPAASASSYPATRTSASTVVSRSVPTA